MALPNSIGQKNQERQDEKTLGDLFLFARRVLYLIQFCEVDDWNSNAFNEVNQENDNFLKVPTKLTDAHVPMEDKMNAIIKKREIEVSLFEVPNSKSGNHRQNSGHQKDRQKFFGGHRGKFPENSSCGNFFGRSYCKLRQQQFGPRFQAP